MSDDDGTRLSTEGLALLFEFSRGPSFAYELATLRIVLANDAALAFYGYEREEFLGMPLDDLVDSGFWATMEALIQLASPFIKTDLLHVSANGRRLPVQITDRALASGPYDIRAVQVLDLDEREQVLQAARRQLDATLKTVASMMRMRDPFTDRHQFRVAALVTAMLREMGIGGEEATGIVTGATVHDLGKQSVPAEILSFAGRLSPAAMEVVRGHSQAGHDLIEDLDTPWPIARMVLEHHERLYGSGYPNGLTSESTLLGSRVIGIADTAEAMMSHRPYRAALGAEPALDELQAGKAIRYDEQSVLACNAVIRSHEFHFPDGVL